MTITFSNDYHESLFVSDKKAGDLVTRSYVRRVAGELCFGGDHCECTVENGGVRGGRYRFEPANGDGTVFKIVRNADEDLSWMDRDEEGRRP